jgi:DNA-binding NarL/FixJ family response regulator
LVLGTEPGRRRQFISKIKLFIADDSLVIRERLIALIDELGRFDVVGVAKTGPEAIDEVAELRPAVLILDMAMPGGNGYAVLQAVKQQQPAPLVIVLTNYPAYRQRCLDAGADYFFDKSAEFDQLLLLLERLKPDTNAGSQTSA